MIRILRISSAAAFFMAALAISTWASADALLATAQSAAQSEIGRMYDTARVQASIRIGPASKVKAERAARVLASPSMATAADVDALTAEAAARGLNETPQALAAATATRYRAYLTALASMDGRRDRAREWVRTAVTKNEVDQAVAWFRNTVTVDLASIPDAMP